MQNSGQMINFGHHGQTIVSKDKDLPNPSSTGKSFFKGGQSNMGQSQMANTGMAGAPNPMKMTGNSFYNATMAKTKTHTLASR